MRGDKWGDEPPTTERVARVAGFVGAMMARTSTLQEADDDDERGGMYSPMPGDAEEKLASILMDIRRLKSCLREDAAETAGGGAGFGGGPAR